MAHEGMTTDQQHTLKSPAALAGRGLFTGAESTITLHPAEPDEGISFRRIDLEDSPRIPARIDYVVDRPRRTTLQIGTASVDTVEHLLSALSGMGIDNAAIDVSGPEIPVCDGSADAFVAAIRDAGIVEQDAVRHPLIVTEPITVRDGDAMVAALPSDSGETEMMYVLDYGPGAVIDRQIHTFSVSPSLYIEQIAPARTFSTRQEAEAMWNRGMFKHLTPRDMLVIDESGPMDNRYRFDNEPVRHKVLDLLGDLSLLGRPIQGRIVAVRSGHALNHKLTRELLEVARRADALEGRLEPAMDIKSIMRLLPHRYPMILVDRVLEMEGDTRAVGVKNVTINEPFFQGHYPSTPIMPGVLIVEAMCQLAGLMLSQKLERTGKIAVLLSLDRVKLRKPVTPGDQLVIETEAIRAGARYGDVQCRSFVGGELVAEARVKFLMVDAETGQ